MQDALWGGKHLDQALEDYREEGRKAEKKKVLVKEFNEKKSKQEEFDRQALFSDDHSVLTLNGVMPGSSTITYNIQVDGTGNKDAGKQVIAAVKNQGLASGRVGKGN